VLEIDGGFAHDPMTMAGGALPRNRIRWTRMRGDANRMRQIWDTSTDGGNTWNVLFDGLYVRRRA
jgi:hypothetical protein